jgi:hypothetical protein
MSFYVDDNYSVDFGWNRIYIDASNNNVVINLGNYISDGISLSLKRIDTSTVYTVTVVTNDNVNIDNTLSFEIEPEGRYKVESFMNQWYKV